MHAVFIVIDRVYRHRHARTVTVSLLALFVPQNILALHRSVSIILIMTHFTNNVSINFHALGVAGDVLQQFFCGPLSSTLCARATCGTRANAHLSILSPSHLDVERAKTDTRWRFPQVLMTCFRVFVFALGWSVHSASPSRLPGGIARRKHNLTTCKTDASCQSAQKDAPPRILEVLFDRNHQ